jgi:hypothetical protein
MMEMTKWFRWPAMIMMISAVNGVGCVDATFREVQFGLLDGVNSFFAQSVVAVLTELVPFLNPA